MHKTETAGDLGISERILRSQGRPGRRTVASTKVTRHEQKELEEAAKREGKVLSEWAREVLLEKARTGPTGTAIFTELVALRLFVNNVLRTLVMGGTMSEKDYAQVLVEVRNAKHDTSREVLSQYQKQNGGQ